ncbi:glycosyltransferase [candidate division KSB1 bacterium]|nr:glycosyltransferase [candidate division KSB1 bacterium]
MSKEQQLADLHKQAIEYSNRQDYTQALQLFISMLEIEPEQPEIMFNSAVMCDLLGETHTALQVIREALQLEPTMPQAHLYLGRMLYRFKEYRAAQASLRRAIQYDISNNDAYNLYRDVTERQGYSVVDEHTDLVFYVVGGCEFHGNSPEESGIGGSESAVVYLTRALAKKGKRIKVFTNCPKPGIYKGVEYFDLVDFYIFNHFNKIERFVSVRSVKPFRNGVNAKQRYLWIHDNPNIKLNDVANNIDRIIAVSEWHKQQWMNEFKLSAEKFYATRNGIDENLFQADQMPAREKRLIFTSQPQRGLDNMLRMMPAIRTQCPDAELHVFYYPSPDVALTIKQICEQQDMSGVYLRGSVDKVTLANELMKARVWVYPTSCLETSCIAAIEAQAAGTPVVCSKLAALPEAVIDTQTGWLIDGDPNDTDYQNQFIEKTVALLKDDTLWLQASTRCREHVQSHYTWKQVADEWLAELL